MSKIIKVDEVTDLSVFTRFAKDEGMFQIEASVYSMVSTIPTAPDKYDHDISEVELFFFINNKKVKYTGFKTLYEQLYGENTFSKYWSEKCEDFKQEYFKTTPYKH
jgi:hypothetical protein